MTDEAGKVGEQSARAGAEWLAAAQKLRETRAVRREHGDAGLPARRRPVQPAFGLNGPQSEDLTRRSSENLQAVSQASTILVKGAQDVSHEWFGLAQDRLAKNLDGLSRLGGCRSVQEFVMSERPGAGHPATGDRDQQARRRALGAGCRQSRTEHSAQGRRQRAPRARPEHPRSAHNNDEARPSAGPFCASTASDLGSVARLVGAALGLSCAAKLFIRYAPAWLRGFTASCRLFATAAGGAPALPEALRSAPSGSDGERQRAATHDVIGPFLTRPCTEPPAWRAKTRPDHPGPGQSESVARLARSMWSTHG